MGLPLALERETRKWFPASNSSHDVRDALVSACLRPPAAAQILYNSSVEKLEPLHSGGWTCLLADGTERRADRVVRCFLRLCAVLSQSPKRIFSIFILE